MQGIGDERSTKGHFLDVFSALITLQALLAQPIVGNGGICPSSSGDLRAGAAAGIPVVLYLTNPFDRDLNSIY